MSEEEKKDFSKINLREYNQFQVPPKGKTTATPDKTDPLNVNRMMYVRKPRRPRPSGYLVPTAGPLKKVGDQLDAPAMDPDRGGWQFAFALETLPPVISSPVGEDR